MKKLSRNIALRISFAAVLCALLLCRVSAQTSPIPVQTGTAAGSFWFGASGGGIQYYFPNPIQYYLDNGYLTTY